MKKNPALSLKKRAAQFVGDNVNTVVMLLLSIIVFLVCAYRIPFRVGLYLSHDEFALFATAIRFLGYDWTPTVSGVPYYSYGYSLLLTPLLLFADSAQQAYRLSLILNAVLAASLVPLSYFLCKRWGIDGFKGNLAIAFVILAAILTGEVIAYSSLGLGEVLLTVLTFASVLCFYKLQNANPKGIWFAVFALLLAYMYTVHMRMLGVLIAAAMVIILMAVLRRIKISHLIVFLATFAVLFFIRFLIEDFVKSNLWLGDAGSNTLEDRVGQFATVMTNIDRFLRALRMLFGQLFYLGIATFTLIFFALHKLILKSIRFFVNLKREGQKDFDYTLIFLLLAFLGTLAISSIAVGPIRGDMVMYGRYNSPVYPVLTLYIFVHILKGEYKFSKISAAIVGAFAILTVWVAYYYSSLDLYMHMDFNAISLAWFRSIPELTVPRGELGVSFLLRRTFYLAYITAAFIGIIIVAAPKFKSITTRFKSIPEKTKNNIGKIIISGISVVLVLFSFANATAFYNNDIRGFDDKNYSFRALVSKISGDDPVFILRPPENPGFSQMYHNQSLLQFELFDRTLHPIGSIEHIPQEAVYIFTLYDFAMYEEIDADRFAEHISDGAGVSLYKIY